MDGMNLVRCGTITAAFAIPAKHQERTADEILYVSFRDILVVRVIDEFAKRFIHRLVGMPRNKDVNPLKPVSRSVIDKVLRFVISSLNELINSIPSENFNPLYITIILP